MQIMEYIATSVSILSIAFFCIYLAGSRGLPTGKRPKTPTMNRFGEQIAKAENPGFQETEDEKTNP